MRVEIETWDATPLGLGDDCLVPGVGGKKRRQPRASFRRPFGAAILRRFFHSPDMKIFPFHSIDPPPAATHALASGAICFSRHARFTSGTICFSRNAAAYRSPGLGALFAPYPGNRHSHATNPERVASIPQIPFIPFQIMFFQHHPEFLLKTNFPMMLFLRGNIFFNDIQIRRTNRKRSISRLPCKMIASRLALSNPMG